MKKKIILLCFPILLTGIQGHGQTPFNTIDSVNINKINAAVLVHGDMWWNPDSQTAHVYYPRGTKKTANFAAGLWISGYDAGNTLHVSAQTYRITGNDYWPGPLNSSGTLTYPTSSDWAKIWKVNRSDIQYFLSLATHTTTNTPAPILTWPGKGNAYAQGNAGVPLTITNNMAPFVDLNSNSNYEPLLGEYPDVKGDQALWWVFSDNGPTHTQTNGLPMGVEVHAMAYAYRRGTLIDNVVYYDYSVINRSSNNYHDVRIALFNDLDLGYYKNDYIGFDSTWRMAIGYDATNDGGGPGHPVSSYVSPPVVGVTMIVLPGDVGTSYVPAGSFTYSKNDNSIIGNPSVDAQYSNYMRAKFRNGQHLTKNYSGPGAECSGFGGTTNCNYVFTGDPSDINGWSECACNNNPDDRRFILSSNDFTLNAGSSQHIVMALVVTDTGEGGCPMVNFNNIKIVADTAWKIYHNPLLPSGINDLTINNAINIYPNPAKSKLFIEPATIAARDETITIYNALGQIIVVQLNRSGKSYEADISELPAGLYSILYRHDDTYTTAKFLKE